MNEPLLQMIGIETHARLLHGLLDDIEAITARAPDGRLLWSSGGPVAIAAVGDGSRDNGTGDADDAAAPEIQIRETDDGLLLYGLPLSDAEGRAAGRIEVRTRPAAGRQTPTPAVMEGLRALSECISNEYRLASELESMTQELSDRYEELNLLYQTDEPGHDNAVGCRVIQQMLGSYIDFLDIGMVALSLPAIDLRLLETQASGEAVDRQQVLSVVQDELFRRIDSERQPIVVNRLTDSSRWSLPDIPYKFIAAPIENDEAELLGTVVVFNHLGKVDFSNGDRNLLMVMAKKIAKVVLSRFDPLTGLNNIRNFQLYVEQAIQQSRQHGESYSILNIDIDQLRVINDVNGREAGDRLLLHVSRLIRDQVRDQDVTARTGGDEFAVLLKNCSPEVATRIAGIIQKRISTTPFLWRQRQFDITATIGVASIGNEIDSASSALGASELARDAAKERGRNKIQLFQTEDTHILEKKEQMLWMSRIQAALREDRFLVFAQPIVPLDPDRRAIHFEILLRLQCNDASGRIVAPGVFMGAAESFYLMPEIDRWVVRNVLRTLASHWPHVVDDGLQFSINLSGQSICDDGFRDFLLQQLEATPVPSSSICFEITETAAIANLEEARSLIGSLKGCGCSLSLDDFGTGLSSFSYLQNLDVDYLKIDGSFVRGITGDRIAKSMVSAINQVGQAMNLQTIAEWVEDAETAEFLRRMGIDFGQGYGLGRPEPLQTQLQKLYRPQGRTGSESG